MNTLKSLIFLTVVTVFSSCQDNDEDFATIEDQESVVTNCSRANCAVQVIIVSPQSARWAVVNRALNQLRAAASFNAIANQNTNTWVVESRGGNNYVVFIPFANNQLAF